MAKYRDIPGYEGIYQISSDGTIVSMAAGKKPIIRKHSIDARGMHSILLSRDGQTKRYSVAKLMAQTFQLPNPNGYNFVVTKDGNFSNLDISNLEWVKQNNSSTHSPEAEEKRAKTWKKKKEDGYRPSSKFYQNHNHSVSAYDDEDCWVATFRSLVIASKLTGANSIGQALVKGCKSGGYYWKYTEE